MGHHKRTKRKKTKRISEFRKERSKEGKGHVRYLYKKFGKTFWGFKLTHGDRVNGVKTITLKQNPEPKPKDFRPAKIVPKVEAFSESKLSPHCLEGWKFGEEDQLFVNGLIESEEKKKGGVPKLNSSFTTRHLNLCRESAQITFLNSLYAIHGEMSRDFEKIF